MKLLITEDMLELKPIPAGVYQAQLSSWEVRTSKEGNPYLNCTFTILSNHPDVPTAGRKVRDNFTFSADSVWKLGQALKAAGRPLNAGEYTVDELVAMLTSALQNTPVLISIDVETYEGQVRNRIRNYLQPKA